MFSVVFQAEITNILWFNLLQCKDLCLFSDLYHFKLTILMNHISHFQVKLSKNEVRFGSNLSNVKIF